MPHRPLLVALLCLLTPSAYGECTVLLRALDAETGEPVPNVTFAKERSTAELWAHPTGEANMDGELRYTMEKPYGWWYSVWKAPGEYVWKDNSKLGFVTVKVDGLDEVLLEPADGKTVEHTFLLRRVERKQKAKIPFDPPAIDGDRNHIPPAHRRRVNGKRSALLSSVVKDMPGFVGTSIEFRFYRPISEKPSNQQLALAEQVYHAGEEISRAVQVELERFEKAAPEIAGDVEHVALFVVRIQKVRKDGTLPWYITCKPPGCTLRRGFILAFHEFTDCNLSTPDYVQ